MPEALTESFCERCGTRYEFKAPARLNPLRKTRGLVSGLRNYIMSQDALGDAVGDAMRSEEESLAARQLEAFHASFNFCIDCRQYTCTNCWNDDAGRCRACAPILGTDDLADRFEASFRAQHPERVASNDAIASVVGSTDAWPASDLPVPANGHAEVEWPAEELFTAMQPEGLAEPSLSEQPAEPATLEPTLADATADIQGPPPTSIARLPEAPPDVLRAWEGDTPFDLLPVPAAAEPEPEPEPEPIVAYEPYPEPLVAFAPEPEPIVAFASEPDDLAERTAAMAVELEPEPVTEPSAVQAVEAVEAVEAGQTIEAADAAEESISPAVAETRTQAEPEVEVSEPASEPVHAAEVEPPAPEPLVEPRRLPLRPIGETILRRPQPSDAPAASQPAPEEETPAVAARRAQLDLLGLGDPGEGPVRLEPRRILPYRSSGAGAAPSGPVSAAAAAAAGSFWDASAREVAGALSQIGVQSCGQCGLSLSASARFCRRCGTRQAQSA